MKKYFVAYVINGQFYDIIYEQKAWKYNLNAFFEKKDFVIAMAVRHRTTYDCVCVINFFELSDEQAYFLKN